MKVGGSFPLSRVTHSLVGRPCRGPPRRLAHVEALIGVMGATCERVAVGLEFVVGTPCIGG